MSAHWLPSLACLCKVCGAYWDCGHHRPTEPERSDLVKLPDFWETMQRTARSMGLSNREYSKLSGVPLFVIEGRYRRTENGVLHCVPGAKPQKVGA